MIIYIVAGERNIQAVDLFGGLYFNLGMTKHSVEDRLKDPDYRRKNAGGKWVILHEWKVEDSLRDSVFHDLLEHAGYQRTKSNLEEFSTDGSNTEEFFACGDDGTAHEVAKIIQHYIDEHSIQRAKYENIKLKELLANRDAQLEELSEEFMKLNDEFQNHKLTEAGKVIEEALKKEESLRLRTLKVESDEVYLNGLERRYKDLIEKKERIINEVPPAKLKLNDIKDFFSSWTWVWLIVLFFSLVECSDRGKKNDWTDEREAILHNETKKVEQKNKIIKKLEQQLKQSNDKLSKLEQPKKEVKTKVLTKLDSKHLKPLSKKEVADKYYYNNNHCELGFVGGSYTTSSGFLNPCSSVKNSKNFNVATSICDFEKGTVIFGFYKPTDSKRKGKAYVMKVLHDPKSLYEEGYEETIWLTRETCLLNK